MIAIRVKGENRVRIFGDNDYTINFYIKRSDNCKDALCHLDIDGKTIINNNSKFYLEFDELQNNMESLVRLITDLMILSTMGKNKGIFTISIDPDTLVGDVTCTDYNEKLKQYRFI